MDTKYFSNISIYYLKLAHTGLKFLPKGIFLSIFWTTVNVIPNCSLDSYKSPNYKQKPAFPTIPIRISSLLCSPIPLLPEKAIAPHSSTLAWKISWTEEPGRLQFMGSLRVGHDWATSLSLFTFMHWRRKWQSTPVFLPGESQGWGSLVGCRLWGRTELDTTEAT